MFDEYLGVFISLGLPYAGKRDKGKMPVSYHGAWPESDVMKYPEQWTPDTAEPTPAETGKGRTDLKSMTNWKIRGPPEKPGNVMANWDESDQVFWDPTRARLTDEGCIYAILTIHEVKSSPTTSICAATPAGCARQRDPQLPFCRTISASISHSRTPKSLQVASSTADGCYNTRTQPEKAGCAQDLLSPRQTRNLPPGPDGLDTILHSYEPRPLLPGAELDSMWNYANAVKGVPHVIDLTSTTAGHELFYEDEDQHTPPSGLHGEYGLTGQTATDDPDLKTEDASIPLESATEGYGHEPARCNTLSPP